MSKRELLCSRHFDLVAAHQAADAARDLEGQAARATVEKTGAIRVAARRRVDHLVGRDRGDLDPIVALANHRAALTQGDHHGVARLGDLVLAPPGLVQGERPLVVVHDVAGRPFDELAQLVAFEDGKAVAGVDERRNASALQGAGVVDHGLLAVRGDDGQVGRLVQVIDPGLVGSGHGALVEGPYLIVVQVGRHEALGGADVVEHPDPTAIDPVSIEPGGVRSEVVAHRREDQRVLAQLAQVIRDVSGHPAEVRVETLDVEGDVQDVKLVRQDVILEPVWKNHDVIQGERARDEDRHAYPPEGAVSPSPARASMVD